MTVIRPNSVSGINSITAQANEIKIFKSDGTQGGLVIGGANLNATSGISTVAALTVTGNVSVGGTLTYQDVTNIDSVGIITARSGINVTGGNVDIGGATHSRNLSVHDATNGVILIEGASNGTSNLMFADENDEDVGMLGYNHASNYLAFTVNAAERLRIASDGKLSITGSTANMEYLRMGGNNDRGLRFSSSSGSSSVGVVHTINAPGDSGVQGEIVLQTNSTERLRITSAGLVGVNCTPLSQFQVKGGTNANIALTTMSSEAAIEAFNDAGSANVPLRLRGSELKYFIGSTERLRITSGGVLRGGSDASTGGSTLIENRYSDDNILNVIGSMYSNGNLSLGYGLRPKSGGSGYVSSFANFSGRRAGLQIGQGFFEFYTTTGSSATAVGSDIGTTRNMLLNHEGKLELRYDNAGGVGAYLSLQNRSNTTGSRTGISFAVGSSDAILNAADYGEAEIHVHRDSGAHGNMEFRCHTGANRTWLKIIGNGQGETGASAGTEGMRGGVAFGAAGIAIDRAWMGQPGIHVFNQNVEGDTDQGTFRFHGWNRSYASYPVSSGSDFGVTVVADGMTITSDRRRKTGITTITGALDTVSQMRGVNYTYVNQDLEPQTHMSMSNGRKLGFIAQEVIPLLPELILDSGEKAVELENGYCDRYNMDYAGVTPLLVEAIKELKAQNEALQARIAALEG